MPTFTGGYQTYGWSLGILMTDGRFARVPGDLGNATSFPYPVLMEVIPNALPREVVNGHPELLEPFLHGARELERKGARAITTNCGFLAVFQKEIANAVSVPVFTSSLMQIPFVQNLLGKGRQVGLLTADATCLTPRHFSGAGLTPEQVPTAIQGMESYPHFTNTILGPDPDLDFEAVTAEMEDAARRLVKDHPNVGAIVMECTNMPPYAAAVQKVTGLPVFDILTLCNMVYHTLYRTPYVGHM